jgi:hypothetical protein
VPPFSFRGLWGLQLKANYIEQQKVSAPNFNPDFCPPSVRDRTVKTAKPLQFSLTYTDPSRFQAWLRQLASQI